MNGCIYRNVENRCELFSKDGSTSWCVCDDPCENRTPSNLDKIRSMTKDELAEFLCEITWWCFECPAEKYCFEGHKGMIDWLDMRYGDEE